MNELFKFFSILILMAFVSCQTPALKTDDFKDYAQSRKADLQLSVYVTAHTVVQQFYTEAGRREAISVLHCNGISKVYVEVYRSGLVIPPDSLKSVVGFLEKNGFEVVGGIATVPGDDFGVKQEAQLGWFNWQNPKTQNDLRKVMEESAPVFKTFIVDDFLCTADTSMESKTAKGDRSWSEYRRSLLTELSKSVFIQPAKEKNPELKIIIKYPQWYDRFHLFGYDLSTEPALFDGVWVGTETRGQYTQRYGFVQPYEGFINYRWIKTLAGDKIGGAWFDHGDCDETDFIEQAYQSVLAGAKELVMFNFDSFITGHSGHHLLRQDFEKLADLAKAVAENPVTGAVAYKPVNSDAGGDLYIMDYIGMLGISLVPDSKYPENASVIFLPTQAATDTAIAEKVIKSISEGKKVIMTTGFLANAKNGEQLAKLAGIQYPLAEKKASTYLILNYDTTDSIKLPLLTDYQISATEAKILLQTDGRNSTPYLVQSSAGNVTVINTHTFSQADFDAVGEVLLCPRQLGLLEVSNLWVNEIRSVFHAEGAPVLDAPSRVSFQQLADGSFVVHNYNRENISIHIGSLKEIQYVDTFSGQPFQLNNGQISINMAPRSRIWIKQKLQ